MTRNHDAPSQATPSNSKGVNFAHFWAGVIIAWIGASYFAWGYTDQVGLITGDGPNYLMMAKAYAHPGSSRVGAEVAASSRFPPLYPLALAWGGGADSLPVAHVITITCFVF